MKASWLHRKTGRWYVVLCIGYDTETNEAVVVYTPWSIAAWIAAWLLWPTTIWVRPSKMFMDGRFE